MTVLPLRCQRQLNPWEIQQQWGCFIYNPQTFLPSSADKEQALDKLTPNLCSAQGFSSLQLLTSEVSDWETPRHVAGHGRAFMVVVLHLWNAPPGKRVHLFPSLLSFRKNFKTFEFTQACDSWKILFLAMLRLLTMSKLTVRVQVLHILRCF